MNRAVSEVDEALGMIERVAEGRSEVAGVGGRGCETAAHSPRETWKIEASLQRGAGPAAGARSEEFSP